jgi:hypothetical protein
MNEDAIEPTTPPTAETDDDMVMVTKSLQRKLSLLVVKLASLPMNWNEVTPLLYDPEVQAFLDLGE